MEASKLLNNDMFVFNYFTFGVLSYREQEYRLSVIKNITVHRFNLSFKFIIKKKKIL